MSFRQDCLRAFCIAIMAVPVFSLASLADASEQNTEQFRQSLSDGANAGTAAPIGEPVESVFFAPTIPTYRPAPLNAAFFEQLFNHAWSPEIGIYQLHPAGPKELYQAWPFTTLGTNAAGDPFLLTVRTILEVPIDHLSEDARAAAALGLIDRIWAIGGDFETEHGMVNTTALLFQGSDGDGSMSWRVIPGFCSNGGDALLACGSNAEIAEIVFEESGQPDDEPQTVIVAALLAAAAAIAACAANALGCQNNATNEFRFCEDQCQSGDQDCLDCCYDRYLIAWDNCFPCGRNRADQGDFSMCYDDDE